MANNCLYSIGLGRDRARVQQRQGNPAPTNSYRSHEGQAFLRWGMGVEKSASTVMSEAAEPRGAGNAIRCSTLSFLFLTFHGDRFQGNIVVKLPSPTRVGCTPVFVADYFDTDQAHVNGYSYRPQRCFFDSVFNNTSGIDLQDWIHHKCTRRGTIDTTNSGSS
jgi:hypothetical protein